MELNVTNNIIINNQISNVLYCGIKLYNWFNDLSLSGVTICGNNIDVLDAYAIYINENCTNNVIYHNNFFGDVKDEGKNQWDNGHEGNYFDDYTGSDANNDGIGDTPYYIPGGSDVDHYPLMELWSERNTYYQFIWKSVEYKTHESYGEEIYTIYSLKNIIGYHPPYGEATVMIVVAPMLSQGFIAECASEKLLNPNFHLTHAQIQQLIELEKICQ